MDIVSNRHRTPESKAQLEAFRGDIVAALVHHLRVTSWVTGHRRIPQVWAAAGLSPASPEEIYNPDWAVADWKLGWEDIAGLDFAVYLDNMFQYGYFGLSDSGWEPMEEGTGYTWISLFLIDLAGSMFLNEWSAGFGGEGSVSVERCLHVAELANARLVLETGLPFCHALSSGGKGEEATEDALTVRQMALLAGMEEMSIRAAANPKKPNPLATFSEHGRTRISLPEAKRWLQSKARYFPIQTFHSGRNSDLGKGALASLREFAELCQRRMRSLQSTVPTKSVAVPDARLASYLDHDVTDAQAEWKEQQRLALADPLFLAALAQLLDFPAELLALRAREVLAKDELKDVQDRLRQLSLGA